MHPLSWWLMRKKRLQPWVGLPNILLQDFAVPELLQNEAKPEAMAKATLHWLDNPAQVRALELRFHQLHDELRRDTVALTTDAIQTLLAR
jgi:lipid-A-disaccharide synthase